MEVLDNADFLKVVTGLCVAMCHHERKQHLIANVRVASSNLVSRSSIFNDLRWSWQRATFRHG